MKGEAWMVRRMIFFLVGVMIFSGVKLSASAAETTGSIRVSFDYGNEPVNRGEVVLYYVAEAFGENYRLTEPLGGGIIRRQDMESAELAQWLALRAGDGGISRILDADGCAEYVNLKEGLYLLTQKEAPEGFYFAAPFLIPIPMYGQWEVYAKPKTSELLTQSPKTGQHPTHLIGAMGLVLSGAGIYLCVNKIKKK